MDTNRTGWAIVMAATGAKYLGRVVAQEMTGELLYADLEDAYLYEARVEVNKQDDSVRCNRRALPIDFMLGVDSVRTRVETIYWFKNDKDENLLELLQMVQGFEREIKVKKAGLVLPGRSS